MSTTEKCNGQVCQLTVHDSQLLRICSHKKLYVTYTDLQENRNWLNMNIQMFRKSIFKWNSVISLNYSYGCSEILPPLKVSLSLLGIVVDVFPINALSLSDQMPFILFVVAFLMTGQPCKEMQLRSSSSSTKLFLIVRDGFSLKLRLQTLWEALIRILMAEKMPWVGGSGCIVMYFLCTWMI